MTDWAENMQTLWRTMNLLKMWRSWRVRRRWEQSRLAYRPITIPATPAAAKTPAETSEGIALLTKARALQERILRRRAWDQREAGEFLQGAVNCVTAVHDPKASQLLLDRAENVYLESILSVNRNYYVASVAIGAVVATSLGMGMWWALSHCAALHLPTADTTFKLLALATLGGVASVLIRLTSIDLKLERNRKFVFVLGIAKSVLAIALAIVIYIILSNHLVSLGRWKDGEERAVWLVAAFLCGFSERFASDILDKFGH